MPLSAVRELARAVAPLQVGIDLRAMAPGFKAHFGRGTGRYVSSLYRALVAEVGSAATDGAELGLLPLVERDDEFVGAELSSGGAGSAPRVGSLASSALERWLLGLLPAGRMTVETQLFLPRRLRRLGCDLLHFPAHVDAPPRSPIPAVVTVLDLIPLKFPAWYQVGKSDWRFRLARSLELRAVREARGVIAISEATKRDVVELLGVAPERIVVTPLGVDPHFQPRHGVSGDSLPKALAVGREAHGLDITRPILLYVGGIDRRKNVKFLLEVLSALKDRLESKGIRPQLVFAGEIARDSYYPVLKAHIAELELAADVVELGYLTDTRLVELYHAASVFLFPSLYEGFGLPVLEAMACGVPVVTGRNSSLPEVTGQAAVLLEDGGVRAWVDAVERLLLSSEVQLEWAQKGIERAASFTWQHTARRTIEAYKYFMQHNSQ